MKVVPVGIAHAGAMAMVHRDAFAADGGIWSEASIAALLDTPFCFALATEDGGAMAMFRTAGDDAELLTIAVAVALRRCGAARALIAAGGRAAANAGADRLILEVSTRNGPAIALYRSLAFARIGFRARYYPDGSDAAVMALSLAALPPCG